jgi:FkbM family methyltransferase
VDCSAGAADDVGVVEVGATAGGPSTLRSRSTPPELDEAHALGQRIWVLEHENQRLRAAGPHDAERRLMRLLFPSASDEWRDDVLRAAGDDDPFLPHVVRRILGGVDRHVSPSPLDVRFGVDDLAIVHIDGAMLFLDRCDWSVSEQIISDRRYELGVSRVLGDLLTPGAVFVDVGANVGYHTIRAAVRVGAGGRVVALEPNPENARLLLLTIRANGFSNIDLVPLALSDRLGAVSFTAYLGSNGGFSPDDLDSLASGRTTVVACIPLDDLRLPRIDVMKVDVEGAEAEVVSGAIETIERCRPAIVMEFSCEMATRVGGLSPREHLDRIVGMGYEMAVIDKWGGPPVPVASPEVLLQSWGDPLRIEDLLFTPCG